MPENMMVGSHKGQNKNWDRGYDQTFGKKAHRVYDLKTGGECEMSEELQEMLDHMAEHRRHQEILKNRREWNNVELDSLST